MQKVILILCNSHGDPESGDWEAVTVEIPEAMRDRGHQEEVVSWVSENLEVIGHDCVYCGVFEWTPLDD